MLWQNGLVHQRSSLPCKAQLANVLDSRAPLLSMPELHDHGPVRKEVNISASQLSVVSRPLAHCMVGL